VPAVFVDGHVEFAELQLGDASQRLLERLLTETKRGTGDLHDGLRSGDVLE
jgi:hypothetical protein